MPVRAKARHRQAREGLSPEADAAQGQHEAKQQQAKQQREQIYAAATAGWRARVAARARSAVVTNRLQTLLLGSRGRPVASRSTGDMLKHAADFQSL